MRYCQNYESSHNTHKNVQNVASSKCVLRTKFMMTTEINWIFFRNIPPIFLRIPVNNAEGVKINEPENICTREMQWKMFSPEFNQIII